MPYLVETPFDQNKYLRPNEEGVCNALVLEWLAQKGEPMKDMRRTITRARKAHAKGVNMQMFKDYGLMMFDAESADGVTSRTGVDDFVELIFGLASSSFLIGSSGALGGHAIGMIELGPSNYLGFDPNNGYYRMGDGAETTWLTFKLFDQIYRYKSYDLTCFGCI